MVARALGVSMCLLAGAAYLGRATTTEPVPLRESLASLPMQIAGWQGLPAPDLEANIVTVLGVDEYVNRLYSRSREVGVGLYIGYYQSQRQGDTIHSPLNCLPGDGWQPMKRGHATIPVGLQDLSHTGGNLRSIEVNRYVVQKGLDKLVILYWYQSHGRIVASEYWGKIYMVVDAIRMNRTDGALVRVVSPVAGSDAAAEETADGLAVDFVKSMFPLLGRYLPA